MGLLNWMLEALKDWVYWFWGLLWGVVEWLLYQIGIPELEIPEIPPVVMTYVSAANMWLPLRESWVFLTTYVTLRLAVIPIKWLLKAIPGVWG